MNLIAILEAEEIQRLNRTIPEFAPGDTVIVSASPIPGNEEYVARTIDNLFKAGTFFGVFNDFAVIRHGFRVADEAFEFIVTLFNTN